MTIDPDFTESPTPPEVIGQGADMERNGRRPAAAPLSDRAAEAHVLSCLLLEPGALTGHELPPDAFYHPEHRLLYLSICRLHGAGKPVALDTIAADLSDRGQFAQCGEWPFLFGVEQRESIPTTVHLHHYRDRVLDLHTRRLQRAHAEAVLKAVASGQPMPEAPARLADTTGVTAIAARLDAARVRLTTPPPEPQTRLYLAGKPIATPGNLVTLIAKSKTGKTAATGAAVAAIIGAHYDRADLDTFRFTAPHTDEAVILMDTEQSPYDAWTCHKRTMERSGGGAEPDWLHHYAMVGDNAKALRDSLPVALDRGRSLHKGVFCLVLDGVADFVASVNDEAECNEFVAHLRKLAVDYNCPIVCVIHSNEGVKTGDDGRGHLGKQLTRKAESNLLLKKDGDVTTITSEKQRKAPITEADGVAFRWSDEHGRHISCGNPEAKASKAGPKAKYDPEAMLTCVPAPGEPARGASQIHRKVSELPSGINIRTFKDYLAKWVQTGEVERIEDRAMGFVFRRRY